MIKKVIFLSIFAAVTLTAAPLTVTQDMITGPAKVQPDGSIVLAGKSAEIGKYATYSNITIRLAGPLDLRGKRILINASSQDGEKIIALYFRAFNQGEEKPVWGAMNYAFPFREKKRHELILQDKTDHGILKFELKFVSGSAAESVDKIQILTATRVPHTQYKIVFKNLRVEKIPAIPHAIVWSEKPERSTQVSPVKHPAGFIRPAEIERMRENIRRHKWAADRFQNMIAWSQFFLRMTPEELNDMIPAEDSFYKVGCPNCGCQSEYAWSFKNLLPDRKHVKCAKCGIIVPDEKRFPQTGCRELKMADGTVRKFRCYLGKELIGGGENLGPYYHLDGLVNGLKLAQLSRIISNASVYAVNGDEKQAQVVRNVLVRFAEVYPKYAYKFRPSIYRSPRENHMAGKLYDWKYHDSGIIAAAMESYTLTANSPVYSKADKLLIENNLAREYKHLITAWDPDRESCLNAVSQHMAASALCARILNDRKWMDHILEHEHGFYNFMKKCYLRDGSWYENSASYENMANVPLIKLISILHRPPEQDIFKRLPRLRKLFSVPAYALLPNGKLPAFNDSSESEEILTPTIDFLNSIDPSELHDKLQNYFDSPRFAMKDPFSAMRFRDPAAEYPAVPRPAEISRPHIQSGHGWALLRREKSADDSVLAINFGKYTSHCHEGVLTFIYFDRQKEIINDLGYMGWFHPNRPWMISSLAHNSVYVDGQMQSRDRVARPTLFTAHGDILTASFEVRNAAAPKSAVQKYARTMFNIPFPGGDGQYVADFFRIALGHRKLYTFHASGEKFQLLTDCSMQKCNPAEIAKGLPETKLLRSAERSEKCIDGGIRARWSGNAGTLDGYFFSNDMPRVFHAEGSGLRSAKAKETPLHVLALENTDIDSRISAIFDSRGKIRDVSKKNETLKVVFADGAHDLITDSSVRRFDSNGQCKGSWTKLPPLKGKVVRVNGKTITVKGFSEIPGFRNGDYLFFDRDDGACRMKKQEKHGKFCRITLADDEEIEVSAGDSVLIQPYEQNGEF